MAEAQHLAEEVEGVTEVAAVEIPAAFRVPTRKAAQRTRAVDTGQSKRGSCAQCVRAPTGSHTAYTYTGVQAGGK
jgi:hypothetical protein